MRAGSLLAVLIVGQLQISNCSLACSDNKTSPSSSNEKIIYGSFEAPRFILFEPTGTTLKQLEDEAQKPAPVLVVLIRSAHTSRLQNSPSRLIQKIMQPQPNDSSRHGFIGNPSGVKEFLKERTSRLEGWDAR